MPFELPDLPYAYDALEPHVDAETMRIHHDLHHKAYVDNANAALAGTEWADRPVEQILGDLDVDPGGKAGGRAQQRRRPREPQPLLADHEPRRRRRPDGALAEAIEATFGSVDELKKALNDGGVKRFGSGWTWLVWDGTGLALYSTPNQDSPADAGRRAAARHRRLGARVLPEVPEQAARLPRSVVERRQLGRGRAPLRGGAQLVDNVGARAPDCDGDPSPGW